ncbi:chemotaxis protein CheW [Methylopila sp. Yamaguchi]|uniref:chemotaxis protein CheW n=1 Tax=Methylopila sp. Yamaguchi TaxID=1437817 RepID=UPI000CC16FE1|nr:chemotaxis protein CheW [Methylopila sp. Yamaguchi]GBD48285.1 chemotaxis protein CheW [Methylopila sp. Yamaguchi]
MSAAMDDATTYVTVSIADQIFGIEIGRVREVFTLEKLTTVPLSPPEVAGVLNLRGRIVTAIDMRTRLGLPPCADLSKAMAVGIEHKGEALALIVDRVGDVMPLAEAKRETKPVTLDPRWASVAEGVHRLDGGLLLILDVDHALEPSISALAA